MDAEQAAALTGPQLQLLGEALRDAFTSEDLEVVLFYESTEWALPEGPTYPVRIQRLLANSRREGWLHDLFNAAWKNRSGNPKLKACVEALEPHAVVSANAQAQRLLDTRYFDLSGIRSEVSEAVMAATGRVLAFGFTYPEPIFLSKFADWLASYFGHAQIKQRMNLLPEIGNVPRHIRDVTRYLPELSSANVLCEVHAVGVPETTLAAFWDGICTEVGSVDSYLVLLLSGGHNAVFPDGITVLSPPTFRLADIDLWTHEMAERKGWREELARAWTQLLQERANYDGRLEVRYLYEAMDDTVSMARLRADEFRRQLEERCNANKTPA
ncbi:MAG TPA: effector-associated domain EAD1-containing protein [Streptosporangiaceae bacterium]|nr:effector-associated domain EAD1-containing protein [Streptosporangiaceae bacterium]